MNKKVARLIVVVPFLFLFGCAPIPYEMHVKPSGTTEISIYYINDTHGAFNRQNTESNYYETGMSYLVTYLKDKKTKAPNNTIILSGGDMFQGGYESNITRGDIMIDAMNIAGFDAMVLGNHEFDWGEEYIQGFANKLNCPILSCNTFYSYDLETMPNYLSPYTIIERSGYKIGIIGGAQENMGSSITGSISSQFYFPNANSYAKRCSDKLRTELGCDLVIGAFHDGDPYKYMDLTSVSSVSNKKYIDGLFLAHDHRSKEGNINGVPYLESACNGRMIGTMNFYMKNSDGQISLHSSSTDNYYAYNVCTTPNQEVEALRTKYASVIGNPNQVLCTLSRSYSREEFTVIVAQAMHWYVNSHKDEFDNETVYFSSHNTGGIRVATISSGELTLSQFFTIMPFDNELCIQKCNSGNISYMENSDYYRTYKASDFSYNSQGLVSAVTISYIADDETYGPRCQQSYVKYNGITSKMAFIAYAQSGVSL